MRSTKSLMYSLSTTNMKANETTTELTAIYIVARLMGLLKSTTSPGGGDIAGILERSIPDRSIEEVMGTRLCNAETSCKFKTKVKHGK